ncbi:MAG: DUF4280 domain-containing protein [Lachnospiraceae bacterium]
MGKKKKIYSFWSDLAFEVSDDEETNEKNKDRELELMHRHFDFYKQIDALGRKGYEYALMGAKLNCTHGNQYVYLDLVKDHGIYAGGRGTSPIATCNDCKVRKNIFTFGACGNGHFEPLYSEAAPHPSGSTIENDNGDERYRCFPILLAEWGHGGTDARSTVIAVGGDSNEHSETKFFEETSEEYRKDFSTIKYKMKHTSRLLKEGKEIEEVYDDILEYNQALMLCDNLLCVYGGIITIVENPEPEFEIQDEEDNNENGRVITFPESVMGKCNNESITLYPTTKWFSLLPGGDDKDAEDRYIISVGPKVLKPNYADDGKLWTSDFSETNEICVKIKVNLLHKDSNETFSIDCVAKGIKAHTYNIHPDTSIGHAHKIFNYNKEIKASFDIESGLVQTGIAYPNCYNAKNDNQEDGPIAVNHMDGSVIEFHGYSSINEMSFNPYDYKLINLIVLE